MRPRSSTLFARGLLLLLAAALAGALVCWIALRRSSRPVESAPLNVVLVLVDTLRADHLGAYGYARPTSPSLDRFAADAVLFEQSRSQGTCTFPSANSILTGRYPQRFTDQEPGHLGIPPGIPTAATALESLGLSTFAVSASPIVRRTPSYVNLVGGFGEGFDVFDESCLDRDASCVTERAGAILKGAREPFFLYLHYMDPHAPYRPPAGTPPRFAGEFEGRDFIRDGDPGPIAASLRAGQPISVSETEMSHLRDLYDEEIAYFDGFFAQFLQLLRDSGQYERTMLVVLSDHGEGFMEHERVVHCDQPFDSLVRTPLIVRLPRAREGRRIAQPVGNIDVLPTILSYLGDDPRDRGFDGRSLRDLIEGRAESPGFVFSSHAIWRSVADGRFKLIWNIQADRTSLFDLAADPGELRPIREGRPELRGRLRAELAGWLRRTETPGVDQIDLADRLERHLRATGYLN